MLTLGLVSDLKMMKIVFNICVGANVLHLYERLKLLRGLESPESSRTRYQDPLCRGQMWCVTLPQTCSLACVMSGDDAGGKRSKRALNHVLRGEGQQGWGNRSGVQLIVLSHGFPSHLVALPQFLFAFLADKHLSLCIHGYGKRTPMPSMFFV